MRLFIKYLLVALLMVIADMIVLLLIKQNFPGGVDSFFIALGFVMIYYFVPFLLLTWAYHFFMKRIKSLGIRFLFIFISIPVIIGYHIIFILGDNFQYSTHFVEIAINALSIAIIGVILSEIILKREVKQVDSVQH